MVAPVPKSDVPMCPSTLTAEDLVSVKDSSQPMSHEQISSAYQGGLDQNPAYKGLCYQTPATGQFRYFGILNDQLPSIQACPPGVGQTYTPIPIRVGQDVAIDARNARMAVQTYLQSAPLAPIEGLCTYTDEDTQYPGYYAHPEKYTTAQEAQRIRQGQSILSPEMQLLLLDLTLTSHRQNVGFYRRSLESMKQGNQKMVEELSKLESEASKKIMGILELSFEFGLLVPAFRDAMITSSYLPGLRRFTRSYFLQRNLLEMRADPKCKMSPPKENFRNLERAFTALSLLIAGAVSGILYHIASQSNSQFKQSLQERIKAIQEKAASQLNQLEAETATKDGGNSQKTLETLMVEKDKLFQDLKKVQEELLVESGINQKYQELVPKLAAGPDYTVTGTAFGIGATLGHGLYTILSKLPFTNGWSVRLALTSQLKEIEQEAWKEALKLSKCQETGNGEVLLQNNRLIIVPGLILPGELDPLQPVVDEERRRIDDSIRRTNMRPTVEALTDALIQATLSHIRPFTGSNRTLPEEQQTSVLEIVKLLCRYCETDELRTVVYKKIAVALAQKEPDLWSGEDGRLRFISLPDGRIIKEHQNNILSALLFLSLDGETRDEALSYVTHLYSPDLMAEEILAIWRRKEPAAAVGDLLKLGFKKFGAAGLNRALIKKMTEEEMDRVDELDHAKELKTPHKALETVLVAIGERWGSNGENGRTLLAWIRGQDMDSYKREDRGVSGLAYDTSVQPFQDGDLRGMIHGTLPLWLPFVAATGAGWAAPEAVGNIGLSPAQRLLQSGFEISLPVRAVPAAPALPFFPQAGAPLF